LNDSAAFAGLQVHTSLVPSLRAETLARLATAAASVAVAISLYWVLVAAAPGLGMSPGVAFVAAVMAALATAAAGLVAAARPQRPSTGSYTALAIDAGGHWHLQSAGGWFRFTPHSISVSPFGWMALQGVSRQGAVSLALWSDSVPAPVWRRLRIAAGWLAQRPEGLVVPASAADPRLLGTS
jgi:multisubunit Na+/H+ antiporter MnhB subunit